MFDVTSFLDGFGAIFHLKYFLYMIAGVAFGMILGALPGLTGSMGIALMLPFTYEMAALDSLVFLLSIYSGGLYGGSITAILINTPGSPANMATVMDGYPMSLQGKANKALGLSLFSSVIGGLIGCIFLVLVMEPLANLSLQFGPAEMFMVAVFGLTVVGSMSKNVLKSVYAALFGVLLGTIGMTSMGNVRGTFDSMYLLNGIPLIPALIGFLAVPEIFGLVGKEVMTNKVVVNKNIKEVLSAFSEIIKRPFLTLTSSFIGVMVGVMPAAGATVASLLSYNQARQWSKNSAKFGTGLPEGVIAAETANNASEGGALATMWVLGLPGSNSTAMLLGALILHGWIPGPRLFLDNKEIVYASISSLFLQQLVMLALGLIACVYATKIIYIPIRYLIPCITILTILGSYSGRTTVFDAALMFGFGLLGWFMKQNDFPVMPVVLGIILGPIADKELLRITQVYDSLWQCFSRPIPAVLLILSVLSIVVPLFMNMKSNKQSASI